jgi:biopolymer transport protein ExbD
MKTYSILLACFVCVPFALAEPPTIEPLALKVEALERQVESLRSDLDAAKKEKNGVADSDMAKHPEIIINLHKDGKIRVEGLELGDKELTARIEPILKKFPNQPIRIRADGEVKYQDVVRVIDLCQRAGAWDLSFATRRPKDEAAPSNGG